MKGIYSFEGEAFCSSALKLRDPPISHPSILVTRASKRSEVYYGWPQFFSVRLQLSKYAFLRAKYVFPLVLKFHVDTKSNCNDEDPKNSNTIVN